MNSAVTAVAEDITGNGMNEEAGDSKQFLTFMLAGEEYGVDILCVQEIRGWEAVTPIPNAPSYIKGVMNLRGTIVPIIDLRQCFGMEAVEYGPVTVVIVLKVASATKTRTMGIVVDAVSDVYSLSMDQTRQAPDLGESVDTSYIRGLANVRGKMVILLDIDRLLSNRDLSELASVSDKLSQAVSAQSG